MHATDVKPTRLGAAQAAVRTFLERVPKNVRVGLIAFSSEPEVAAPPTTDRDLVRQSVNELDFLQAYGGTALGDALAAAVDLGKKAVRDQKGPQTIAYTVAKKDPPVSILFLSDGKQTRGLLQPLEGAQRAKAAGIPVYTVALGTPEGVLTTPVRRFRRRPGAAHSGAARPGHAGLDRQGHRRQVLQRAVVGRASVGLQGARLQAGPRQGPQGSHERSWSSSRRSPSSPQGSSQRVWAPRLP